MLESSAAPHTKILILSGPSGVGKTTIVRQLQEQAPVPIELSISATTRPPRQNEVNGKDYHFLSRDEFESRLASGEFIEWAEVHKSGHLYGTLKSEVDRITGSGKWVLLEIDVEGARNVMQLYPDAISVFLQTPSVDEYERRLRARGTESEEVIERRLRTAREELEYAASYRYRVINDDLGRAVRELCDLLAARETEQHAR